ncbi:lactate utilization protein [Bacillaceae bacterium]
MRETPQEILRQLEIESRRKEEPFMQKIAGRLGRQRLTEPPAHPFRGAPDFWRSYDLPLEERIERFLENWRKNGGEALRFPEFAAAGEFIADLCRRMGAKSLIRHDQPELAALALAAKLPQAEITVWRQGAEEDLLAKAAGADIGIVLADYAVAHTGSVVAMSGPGKGRAVSLLPTAFVALVKAENVKTKLGDVMRELSGMNDRLPAGVHFISGPSRSADIENDLTIGVHGPGIVYALVVG